MNSMLMLGAGLGWESIILILFVALILFGGKELANKAKHLSSGLASGWREFWRMLNEDVNKDWQAEIEKELQSYENKSCQQEKGTNPD